MLAYLKSECKEHYGADANDVADAVLEIYLKRSKMYNEEGHNGKHKMTPANAAKIGLFMLVPVQVWKMLMDPSNTHYDIMFAIPGFDVRNIK